jgi:hypothetical protein
VSRQEGKHVLHQLELTLKIEGRVQTMQLAARKYEIWNNL